MRSTHGDMTSRRTACRCGPSTAAVSILAHHMSLQKSGTQWITRLLLLVQYGARVMQRALNTDRTGENIKRTIQVRVIDVSHWTINDGRYLSIPFRATGGMPNLRAKFRNCIVPSNRHARHVAIVTDHSTTRSISVFHPMCPFKASRKRQQERSVRRQHR